MKKIIFTLSLICLILGIKAQEKTFTLQSYDRPIAPGLFIYEEAVPQTDVFFKGVKDLDGKIIIKADNYNQIMSDGIMIFCTTPSPSIDWYKMDGTYIGTFDQIAHYTSAAQGFILNTSSGLWGELSAPITKDPDYDYYVAENDQGYVFYFMNTDEFVTTVEAPLVIRDVWIFPVSDKKLEVRKKLKSNILYQAHGNLSILLDGDEKDSDEASPLFLAFQRNKGKAIILDEYGNFIKKLSRAHWETLKKDISSKIESTDLDPTFLKTVALVQNLKDHFNK